MSIQSLYITIGSVSIVILLSDSQTFEHLEFNIASTTPEISNNKLEISISMDV